MKSMYKVLGSYSVTALVLLALAFPGSAFAIAGKFQYVNGQVQIINAAGAPHRVSKGDVINEGDTISASANGFAQIKMEDGGFFAVRPDTQFKIDTFNFNGKEDGSEKGIFSLIKGSLRSVTGLIGKIHRDNYKILTASSTIGIRGSGADVGHDDSIGTAVHTLFGGHTLTSNGKTIETGPGQTALAAPGEGPKFVPNFPFNTSTSPGNDKQGNGSTGNNKQGNNDKGQNGNNNKQDTTADLGEKDVVIPITTINGINLTTNTDASGNPIGASIPQYVQFSSGIVDSGGTFFVAEQGSNKQTYPLSNYTFGSNGALLGADQASLNEYNADRYSTQTELLSDTPSSFEVLSGTFSDLYHTPDNSLFIGRGSNVVVDTTCGVCSGTDTFVSLVSIVGQATTPAIVQTLTGTSNSYTMVASTQPADGFGNVGTLNSASLVAHFNAQTVDLHTNLFINSKTLDASKLNLPIVNDGFDAFSGSGGLTVTCVGGGCGAGYAGDIGGKFFGNSSATAGFAYQFFPTSDTTGNFTDLIQGVVAFTSGTSPTANVTDPGPVGSGGSVVGLATVPSSSLFSGFNTVDNTSFASRLDANGNLVAFAISNSNGGESSASSGTSSVIQDGSDSSLGVVWGRWSGGYIANAKSNGTDISLAPSGHLAFITGSQITTTAQLAAMPGLGIPNATYTMAGGFFPSTLDNVAGSHLTSASATVVFGTATPNISLSVAGAGTPGSGFNNWNASGSGLITDFMSQTGIQLTGSCSGGGGVCAGAGTALNNSANGNSFNSAAHGGFVGSQAQGLISTFGLTAGAQNLAGVAYLKR